MADKKSRLVTEINWLKSYHEWVDLVTEKVFSLAHRQTGPGTQEAEDQCRVFDSQPQTGLSQIVANCNIKTSHLVSPFLVRTEYKEWDAFYALFTDAFQASEEPSVFDVNLYGLGWFALELPPGGKYPELIFVDLSDVLWDHRYRIDRSPVYWRRARWSREEFEDWLDANDVSEKLPDDEREQYEVYLEYGRKEWRLLTLETQVINDKAAQSEKVWKTWENPCVYETYRGLPIYPLIGLYPLKVDVPLGDYVLCYADDTLVAQMKAGLIEATKHGLGWLFVDEDQLGPEGVDNLTGSRDNPIANPVVGFSSGNSTRPPFQQAQTLSMPVETTQLLEKAERDRDKKAGVTDYEQGGLPQEQPKYAIQVQQQQMGAANRATRDLNEHTARRKAYLKCFAAWVLHLFPTEKPFPQPPDKLGNPQPDIMGVLEFTSGGKQYVLPKAMPNSFSIQDQSAKLMDQQKAITKAQLFATTFQQMPVNPKTLATQVLTNLGDSQEEIDDLFEAPQPPPAALAAPMGQEALPAPESQGTDLSALLGTLGGNDGGMNG